MSQNLQTVAKFQIFQLDSLVDFAKCCQTHIYLQNFVSIQPRTSPPKICKILRLQRCNLKIELEKCCQTHIYWQNLVSIQPRTSPPKICKILLIFPNFANIGGPGARGARAAAPDARRLQDAVRRRRRNRGEQVGREFDRCGGEHFAGCRNVHS